MNAIMKEIERKVTSIGYEIYSIDYITDFSDTLNRNTLISHFFIKHSFRIKGNEPQYSNQTFILEHSRSAGTDICQKCFRIYYVMQILQQNSIMI